MVYADPRLRVSLTATASSAWWFPRTVDPADRDVPAAGPPSAVDTAVTSSPLWRAGLRTSSGPSIG